MWAILTKTLVSKLYTWVTKTCLSSILSLLDSGTKSIYGSVLAMYEQLPGISIYLLPGISIYLLPGISMENFTSCWF